MTNVLDYDCPMNWNKNSDGKEKEMPYRVKEFRKKRNMSQAELSEKSGVSRAIIVRLEDEDTEFVTTTSTLQRIANALDTKVSDIFLG